MATDRLDLLCDIAGAAALGSLEDHMLDQVGNAVQRCGLVTGPSIDPNADGRGREMGRILADDPQSIIQPGQTGLTHAQAARARPAT